MHRHKNVTYTIEMPGSSSFIRNTFLHLIAGLFVTGLSAENPVISDVQKKPLTQLVLFFVLVGLLIMLYQMQPGLPKYGVFALMCILLGQNLTALEQRLSSTGTLQSHMLFTAAIFVAMAGVGMYDNQNMLQWETYLGFSLLSVIFAMFCSALFLEGAQRNSTTTWINRLVTILFTIYVGFDVEVLKENAKIYSNAPDYIKESVALYLDFYNLFVSVGSSD